MGRFLVMLIPLAYFAITLGIIVWVLRALYRIREDSAAMRQSLERIERLLQRP